MDLHEFFFYGMDRTINGLRTRQGLTINLGHLGGKVLPGNPMEIALPEWDAEHMRLPFADGSVATIWALHFMEHISNVLGVLRECERVLTSGGILNIVVPYGVSHCAVQDLTHVHRFNEDTWKTLMDNRYYDPAGEWQFRIGTNVIMGVKGENLGLFTQLIKK